MYVLQNGGKIGDKIKFIFAISDVVLTKWHFTLM